MSAEKLKSVIMDMPLVESIEALAEMDSKQQFAMMEILRLDPGRHPVQAQDMPILLVITCLHSVQTELEDLKKTAPVRMGRHLEHLPRLVRMLAAVQRVVERHIGIDVPRGRTE